MQNIEETKSRRNFHRSTLCRIGNFRCELIIFPNGEYVISNIVPILHKNTTINRDDTQPFHNRFVMVESHHLDPTPRRYIGLQVQSC